MEKTLIFLTFIGMLVVPLIAVFTPWLAFASSDPPEWTGRSGVIVFAFAIWLSWHSHTDLGQNWSTSLEIREEHSLVVLEFITQFAIRCTPPFGFGVLLNLC